MAEFCRITGHTTKSLRGRCLAHVYMHFDILWVPITHNDNKFTRLEKEVATSSPIRIHTRRVKKVVHKTLWPCGPAALYSL